MTRHELRTTHASAVLDNAHVGDISDAHIMAVLIGDCVIGALLTLGVRLVDKRRGVMAEKPEKVDVASRSHWRMPPIKELAPPRLTLMSRVWMGVLRAYLVVAAGLLLFKLVHMTIVGGA